jgi:hypothetical protein
LAETGRHAVDAHLAVGNPRFGCTPGGQAAIGEVFLQTDELRIGKRHEQRWLFGRKRRAAREIAAFVPKGGGEDLPRIMAREGLVSKQAYAVQCGQVEDFRAYRRNIWKPN